MNYAIMDKKGIIETFESLNSAMDRLDDIRSENDDIEGDLLVIEIHYTDN